MSRRVGSETEEEEAEAAAAERAGELLDALPAPVFAVSPEGRLLHANRAFERLAGRPIDAVVGSTLHEVLAPEDAGRLHEAVTRALLERRTVTLEVGGRDGASGCSVATVTPVPGRRGRGDLALCSCRDTTEEARRTRLLRLQATVLDQIEDHVTVTDLEGRITYDNHAVQRDLGRTREELLGQPTAIYGEDPRRGATQREILERTLADGAWRGEVINYARDGREIVMELRTRVVRDERGAPIALCGVGTDVTERKRAEAALRDSEARFRELAELLPATVFEVDVAGRALFVNQRATETFGYAPAEIEAGLSLFDVVVPEDRPRAAERLARIARGETLGPQEYTLRRKDGSTLPASIHASPIFRDGRHVGFRGFIVDITERKEAEEASARLQAQLTHAQKLEALGTLAGGIAHDFNNLLAAIQGGLTLLGPRHGPPDPVVRDMLEVVGRGAGLTRQLLGFARRGRYNVRPLDLAAALERTSGLFGSTRKDLTIRHQVAPGLRAVLMDHGQLEQVLLNLFVNAGQAMPDGGTLLLRAEEVELGPAEVTPFDAAPGRYVRLDVADTGVGMDAATRARLFEPFFTTKGAGQGTGLGLASVYGILRSHGGFVDVESAPGEGTTFRLFLPATDRRPEADEPAPAPAPPGRGTILLVDDEAAILRAWARVLSDLGYRVLTAASGAEAIALVRRHRDELAVVILDMVMPGMSGRQTFDAVKEAAPDVKVLLASGYSVEGQAQEILSRGCDGVLQKPFDLATLSAELRRIL